MNITFTLPHLRLLSFLLVLFCLVSNDVLASHAAGADLSYECVNNCTVRVHLKAYRDCSGSSGLSNAIVFTSTSPGCTEPTPIGAWSTQVTSELNGLCPNLTTQCTTPGAVINGIQEFYWWRDYDICGIPSCTFTISWTSCCRTPALNSLNNAGSQPIHVTLEGLTTNPTTCNSSPEFDYVATPYICIGQSHVFPQRATDPDGDSLSYELGNCFQADTTQVNYNLGYSALQPLGPSWTVQIDPVNGNLSFTPLPGIQVAGVICMVVKEWRNGIHIGTVTRDINVTAIPCTGICGSNYVEGILYHDANTNCTPDPGEARIANAQVSINSGAGIMTSNSQGVYHGWLAPGTYVLEPILPSNGLYQTNCPVSGTHTVTFVAQNDTSLNHDFGRIALVDCPSMWVDMSSMPHRPCSTTLYTIDYCNLGTDTAYNAYVEVELESFQTFVNVTGATWIGSSGNVHTISVGDVPHGFCGSFNLRALTDCNFNLLGLTACAEAHIYPDSLCFPASPSWDLSTVSLEGGCVGDTTVCFTVSNSGQAMQGTTAWRLYENSGLVSSGSLQLCGGCDTVMCFLSTGNTLRLEVDQRPNHPGYSHPNDVVELCGEPDSIIGEVTALPLDDLDDFIDISCSPVVAAYDPNSKHVSPSGVTTPFQYVDSTAVLTYLIDFQNIGSADAIRVVLEDSLDPRLDILSIQPGASSHNYTFQVLSGRRLQFVFDNINLVPASQDSNASIGWVQYSVRQIPGNTFGNEIRNNCNIFFDMNAPIRTNTVLNTIGWPAVPVSIEVDDISAVITIWPNPAENEAYARVTGTGIEDKLRFELYSLMGQRVHSGDFDVNQLHHIDLSGLSTGVYVYRVSGDGRMLKTGKLVVK